MGQQFVNASQCIPKESKCHVCSCGNEADNEIMDPATSSTSEPMEAVVQQRPIFASGIPTETQIFTELEFAPEASISGTLSRSLLEAANGAMEGSPGASSHSPHSRQSKDHRGSLDWLNWLCAQVWPNIKNVIKRHVLERIEPEFDKEVEKFGIVGRPLKGIKFSNFDLGDEVPLLGPIKAYRRSSADHYGIEIDCGMVLDCQPLITIDVAGYHMGIHRLVFDGSISVILKPLLDKEPIIGGLQCFLFSRPKVDFQFTGVLNAANGSLLHRITKKVVLDQISKMVVLPNRFNMTLVKEWELDADIVAIQSPRPDGIVRIRVHEAANLPEADINVAAIFENLPFGGSQSAKGAPQKRSGSSDPYCLVHVGSQILRTPTISNCLFPVWPEDKSIGDFFVFNVRQPVEIAVYDDDFGLSADDLLGSCTCQIRSFFEQKVQELVLDTSTREKKPKPKPTSLRATIHGLHKSRHKSGRPTKKTSAKSDVGSTSAPKGFMGFVKNISAMFLTGSDDEEDAGEKPSVSVSAEYFEVVDGTPWALTELRELGKGLNEGFLSALVYGMRPVGARASVSDATGMRLQISIQSLPRSDTAQSLLTKPCKRRAERGHLGGISEDVVKIVQNLKALQPSMTVKEVAQAVEMDVSAVQRILNMRQIMPLVFNEGLHFLIGDAETDVCVIDLMAAGKSNKNGKVGKDQIVASVRVGVKSLMDEDRFTLNRIYMFRPEDEDKVLKKAGTNLAKKISPRQRNPFACGRKQADEDAVTCSITGCLSDTEKPGNQGKTDQDTEESQVNYEVGIQLQLFCLKALSDTRDYDRISRVLS